MASSKDSLARCEKCGCSEQEYQLHLSELTANIKRFNLMLEQHERTLRAREQAVLRREQQTALREAALKMRQQQARANGDEVQLLRANLVERDSQLAELQQRHTQLQRDVHEQQEEHSSRLAIKTEHGLQTMKRPTAKLPPRQLPRRIMPVHADLLEKFEAGKAEMKMGPIEDVE